MFNLRPVQLIAAPALVLLTFINVENDCLSQQTEQSLFVIKTPPVANTQYGEQPNAIRFAQIQEEENSSTRESVQKSSSDILDELDKEMAELEKDLDMEDSSFDEDPSLDDESADDMQPTSTPMTSWNLKPMTSITPGLRPVSGKSPSDQSWQLTSRQTMPLANSEKLFAWAAPDIRHNPLYFEDVALERYGQTKGFVRQHFASGLHFLKSAAFLPYYSIYDPVNSCDGPLGYCRPGVQINCTSQKHYFGNPFQGVRRSSR